MKRFNMSLRSTWSCEIKRHFARPSESPSKIYSKVSLNFSASNISTFNVFCIIKRFVWHKLLCFFFKISTLPAIISHFSKFFLSQFFYKDFSHIIFNFIFFSFTLFSLISITPSPHSRHHHSTPPCHHQHPTPPPPSSLITTSHPHPHYISTTIIPHHHATKMSYIF